MDPISILAGMLMGAALGTLAALLKARRSVASLRSSLARAETALEYEKKSGEEKALIADHTLDEIKSAFKGLSLEALKEHGEVFLSLAGSELARHRERAEVDRVLKERSLEGLVKPLSKTLTAMDRRLGEVEQSRREAYGSLSEQVRALNETQQRLESEAGNLARALRSPRVRGRWGEIQLRRVVELAGMVEHCDFEEQVCVSSKASRLRSDKGSRLGPYKASRLRPDLIVKLPGSRIVVVDAKTPLEAYLDAAEDPDGEEVEAHLKRHARHVEDHINRLSGKAYFEQFDCTPEFVVMFLPGECFFSAALEQDPALIEKGVARRVILATPTTLIGLLHGVACGWRQEKLVENAQEISELGRELYDRIRTLAERFQELGKSLDGAVGSYRKASGALEGRVLAAARRFTDLGIPATKKLGTLKTRDANTRDAS